MFYSSNQFKVLEAGIQLAQMQQQIHTHNIANLETPGYKAKALTFQSALSRAEGEQQITSIRGSVTENKSTSLRPDGNNVDYESESVGLYKAYVQYSMLLDKVKGQFEQYNYVLNCNMK